MMIKVMMRLEMAAAQVQPNSQTASPTTQQQRKPNPKPQQASSKKQQQPSTPKLNNLKETIHGNNTKEKMRMITVMMTAMVTILNNSKVPLEQIGDAEDA